MREKKAKNETFFLSLELGFIYLFFFAYYGFSGLPQSVFSNPHGKRNDKTQH